MTPPTSRTWARRGRTPVIRVRGRSRRRISIAALTCYKPGERSRLIYRPRRDDGRRHGRKSFAWTDLHCTGGAVKRIAQYLGPYRWQMGGVSISCVLIEAADEQQSPKPSATPRSCHASNGRPHWAADVSQRKPFFRRGGPRCAGRPTPGPESVCRTPQRSSVPQSRSAYRRRCPRRRGGAGERP
jgi:hypothetical protein